jgi:hypothetical protein
MVMLDFIVGMILGGWLIVSIVGQFHSKRINRIRRYDYFNLIPLWTFFAPNPGQSDYHLLYRDKLRDGSLTDWAEIPLTHRREVKAFVWNPMKRETKVLADIVNSVATLVDYHREQNTPVKTIGDAVMLSTPYLILMNIVLHRAKNTFQSEQRQFALAETHGFDSNGKPDLILCSPFHTLTYVNEPNR